MRLRDADGSAATRTDCGPPSLSVSSAYEPLGTSSVAGPPSVLSVTSSGATANATWPEPPPVLMPAVWLPRSRRTTGPPAESACSAPVRPFTASDPPSVLIVAGPLIPVAVMGPPPVSACSGPVRPFRSSEPPSVSTVSRPVRRETVTGAPPDSTFAPATPEMATGAPLLATVTGTVAGTVTTKLTAQSLVAHSGSARVRRPPETESATRGGGLTDLS